jgi:hypothetical protein
MKQDDFLKAKISQSPKVKLELLRRSQLDKLFPCILHVYHE